jgi:hypothetical protein
MKVLILSIGLFVFGLAFFASMGRVQAAEMLTLTKSSGASIATVDASSFEKAWGSSTPACIKDGGKVLKVNAAFISKGLKSNACSNTDKAKAKQKLLGYSVVKFDLVELPENYAKQAMGIK